MATEIIEKIAKDLEFLKKEVTEIKEHMIDVDSIMTEDDYKAISEYRNEKARGKLKSFEDLKKELKA